MHVYVCVRACDRDDPVHESCIKAVQRLTQLVKNYSDSDLVRDLKVTSIETVTLSKELKEYESRALEYGCNKCPEFNEHVSALGHVCV